MAQFVLSFTPLSRSLTLPLGSLPTADELIWMILLVHYLPDLYPEPSNDAIEIPWQTSDEFKDDHDFACTRAANLWSWIYVRFFDGKPSWDRLTKEIEIDAWRGIEFYQEQDASPKIPKKIEISHVCLSPTHQHD